jgi:GH25 family lysozyme M1 (1,4-beta-N-acetylmuramidase)
MRQELKINPKVIDLYHLDRVASFEDAHKAGIRAVIHKATEGATLTDRLYAQRRMMVLDAGMLWGAYHFLRPGDVAGQAHRFIDEAQPTQATLLAADHEDPRVSLSDLVDFLDEIETETGRKAVIYSGFLIKEQLGPALQPRLIVERLAQHRLWLAQYGLAPKCPPAWKAPWLWQFTGDGEGPEPHSISGIGGKCDINSFDGSDEELAAQWSGGSTA